MREYMLSLGTVLMLVAFANMIVPEGTIKKYVSLATGFMIITTAISIIPGKIGEISFPSESFQMSEEKIAGIEAEYYAEVMKEHKKNLETKIGEHMTKGGKVFVEVTEKGEIISITLISEKDESKAILYITENLGVERERIRIKNDKD